MTWTYSGDPSSSDLDTVRFLLGDRDESDPLLQDEEISFLITEWDGNLYFAAAAGAESLSEQFAREVNFSGGDGTFTQTGELQQKYAQAAIALRKLGTRLAGRSAKPYAGGISRGDVDSVNQEVDRIPTSIEMGMHDNTREAGADPSNTSRYSGNQYNPLLSDQSGA